ncbi:glutathione S-transferase family protein [Photobacterium sp. TY1-4]|uniref:glutathione S-transferase family protein n=1 Tax=Photobacterium sp. TY1-4 TaxID=2899122 RepID=UPI0021BF8FF0|nr:glutathione S-transferase family protein [Photobacterium sp. TY1-4]UXI03553.1 glutathione S-transferase family protein [Photobacterium sp. TY1-4]
MKLYLNATSPYARAVRIAAIENQLDQTLELVWVDPWQSPEALLAVNPAAKIPVLVTDAGAPITETLNILFYLDQQAPNGPQLLSPLPSHPQSLTLLGYGQALMDATFQTVIARKHDGNRADQHELGQRRIQAIHRLLAAIDHHLRDHQNHLRDERHLTQTGIPICDVVIGIALAYLDFRLSEIPWRSDFPALADWMESVEARESFAVTRFK